MKIKKIEVLFITSIIISFLISIRLLITDNVIDGIWLIIMTLISTLLFFKALWHNPERFFLVTYGLGSLVIGYLAIRRYGFINRKRFLVGLREQFPDIEDDKVVILNIFEFENKQDYQSWLEEGEEK